METFEVNALATAPKKPKCWFRYVDDTFVVWSHGEDELQQCSKLGTSKLHKLNNSIYYGDRKRRRSIFPGCNGHKET